MKFTFVPAYSFGTGWKASMGVDSFNTPGPGTYNSVDLSVYKPSTGNRRIGLGLRTENKPNNFPAPNKYDIKDEISNLSTKPKHGGYSFGKFSGVKPRVRPADEQLLQSVNNLNKKKKKKKNKDEADDDEEEEKEVLTIIYDKKSFGKYYETLKKEIMGNFTNFDIVDQEYPLPANKKFFSKITFFTQMGVSLLIFSGQKLKDKLTIIPSAVFDGIEKNKWFVMIGNFLLHQWLNKNLSTTGAFEIYYKDRIIFSKLATNKLPKEADIHKEIKRINKRIKGKNKKKKYEEDDDEDEDL